jgi:hypothetical protein
VVSTGKKIALCFAFIGIFLVGIVFYLRLIGKINNLIIYVIISGLTVFETIFVIFAIVSEKRKTSLQGKIIYKFHMLNNKKELHFTMLYIALSFFFIDDLI